MPIRVLLRAVLLRCRLRGSPDRPGQQDPVAEQAVEHAASRAVFPAVCLRHFVLMGVNQLWKTLHDAGVVHHYNVWAPNIPPPPRFSTFLCFAVHPC